MRAAPSVAAPVGDCPVERGLIVLAYLVSGLLLAAWALGWQLGWQALPVRLPPAAVLGLGALLGGLVGVPLARRALPGDVVQLVWDGEGWSIRPAAPAAPPMAMAALTVALDVGPWLLLRAWPGSGRPRWLVLRQRQVGGAWHLLRVALQAHAGGRR